MRGEPLGEVNMVPIPIPIGVRRVAAVQGCAWRMVSCTVCGQQFAYLLRLEATGVDHDLLFLDAEGSAQRAQEQAQQNLSEKCRNAVRPVPCPNCGYYQDDMVRLLREEGMSNGPVIAGLAVAALSLIPLAFRVPHLWILTVVGVLVGLALLAYADVAASRFDPNAGDPESRKALGRRRTIWGAQLDEMLQAGPNTPDVRPCSM